MIPFHHTVLTYPEYKRVEKDINFMVYFDKSQSLVQPTDIINQVVSPTLNEFNKLEFGIHFTILGWDVTDNPEADDYIFYKYHGQSACYEAITNIKLVLGLWENATIEGRIDTLKHEILHGLGFGHKRQIIQRFLKYEQGELNKDDIHGISTIYTFRESKHCINGRLENKMKEFDDRQVFLRNKKNEKLCYQSPIDSTGYYEFNINEPVKNFDFLYLFKKGNKLFYSKDQDSKLNIKPIDDIYKIKGIDWGVE